MSELPCWRRNGVWGRERPRCERLETVIHCRNCEEYVGRGRALLERLAEERMITSGAPETEDEVLPPPHPACHGTGVLVFRVSGNWLALPGRIIHQVAPSSPIRVLPHRRLGPVRGLVNVAGRLFVCLSLSETLGIPRIPHGRDDPSRSIYERLVAVQEGALRFAFRAGEVRGVYRRPELLEKTPPPGAPTLPACSQGGWEVEVRPQERVWCAVLEVSAVMSRVKEYLR